MLQMKELCALGLPAVLGLGCSSCVGYPAVFTGEWGDDIHVSAAVFLSLPCVPGAALAVTGRETQLG